MNDNLPQQGDYRILVQGSRLYFNDIVSDYMSDVGENTQKNREKCRGNFSSWIKNYKKDGYLRIL